MAGCDHLFLLSPPSPHQPEQERNAIDAAQRAGVGHVVALSVLGFSPDASVAFGRWHGEIDRYLAESGLPHTLLLPSGFMQNFLTSAQYVADQGILCGMTGETRVSYIDTRDVAAVAARVLTSPGHQGKAYTLTGPEALSGMRWPSGCRRPPATRSARSMSRPTPSARRWPRGPARLAGRAPGRAQHHDAGGRPRRRGHRRGGQADRTPAQDLCGVRCRASRHLRRPAVVRASGVAVAAWLGPWPTADPR